MATLLVQIVLIIVAARVAGLVAKKLGQPSVIGEMAVGIALGPSLLGAIAPDASARLFPASSFAFLNVLSQVGVMIFLFSVGLDFHWSHVRHRARTAVVISNVSIIVPFLLGTLVAWPFYETNGKPEVPFRAFALFMGIAMSITAFPVLARILTERRMLTTPLGALALTCAAIDDVIAWILLAFVVAVVTSGGSIGSVATTLALTGLFVVVMIFVVRPLLAPWINRRRAGEDPFSSERLAMAMALLFASAWTTEMIGVHALFGSFVAGAILPASDELREGLRVRLETFTSILLLPLFFAYTGLRTEIGLIGNWSSLAWCLGIIAVATAGKLGAAAVTARVMGLDWRSALTLGALINTRGLMELIALNIGYDLGVISAEVFTVLVIMALVTTMMTGPLVDLAQRPTANERRGEVQA